MEIDYDGNERYLNKDGLLHREDGPACVYFNGDKYWWIEGRRHRIDGPAIELTDGTKQWWIHDVRIDTVKNIFTTYITYNYFKYYSIN